MRITGLLNFNGLRRINTFIYIHFIKISVQNDDMTMHIFADSGPYSTDQCTRWQGLFLSPSCGFWQNMHTCVIFAPFLDHSRSMAIADVGMVDNHWKLSKYGRYRNEKDVSTQDRWQIVESEDIWLVLEKSHHLLVVNGSTVLENYSLWNADSWIRGAKKIDSLLIFLKVQNESRRFRIKFATYGGRSGVEHCEAAVGILSEYFTIKPLDSPEEAENMDSPQSLGDVSVGKLAKILSGDLKAKLPLAYQQTQLPSGEMDMFVRLCLSDANFPAFVERVEDVLKNIIKEGDETPGQ